MTQNSIQTVAQTVESLERKVEDLTQRLAAAEQKLAKAEIEAPLKEQILENRTDAAIVKKLKEAEEERKAEIKFQGGARTLRIRMTGMVVGFAFSAAAVVLSVANYLLR